MQKSIKYLLVYTISIVIINILFYGIVGMRFDAIDEIYYNGIIVKINPIGYAMVFAHGDYHKTCVDMHCTKYDHYHATYSRDGSVPTKDLLDRLYKEGYTQVWGSWCNTGNYPYMFKYGNGTEVKWYDWVSISGKNGTTIPIFTGVSFIRVQEWQTRKEI